MDSDGTTAPVPVDPYDPGITILKLDGPNAWLEFADRMDVGHVGPRGPWKRILGLLRGMEATTCVIESNYVCLDYRSEVATFYSQLNEPAGYHSPRLHFFANDTIDVESLFGLDKTQRDAYLGYVVCRQGDLPLVGRTVLRVPNYVDTAAAILETVYLCGQRLKVFGVPFMQQDERFAVCAQVAAWTAHYSAYRRGLVERRLIADFVGNSGSIEPMRPTATKGLVTKEVSDLFRKAGLRTELWTTPHRHFVDDYPHLSLIQLDSFAKERIKHCRAVFGEPVLEASISEILERVGEAFANGSEDSASELLKALIQAARPIPAGEALPIRSPDESVTEFGADYHQFVQGSPDGVQSSSSLQDSLLEHLVRPYIESKWPIYCETEDHALLLCGLSREKDQIVFFFHDDQYGPYLASRYAFMASRGDFQYQAQIIDKDGVLLKESAVPERDLAPDIIGGSVERPDNMRGLHALLVPTPTRLLLAPSAAEEQALRLALKSNLPNVDHRRVVTMMGTDYKDGRLQSCGVGVSPGRVFFASLQLSEWVVVVEGLQAKEVVWEFVFDGSSGSEFPVLQLARCGKYFAYTPAGNALAQTGEIDRDRFDRIPVPSRIGKGRRSDTLEE
jgi:hypothetical protein